MGNYLEHSIFSAHLVLNRSSLVARGLMAITLAVAFFAEACTSGSPPRASSPVEVSQAQTLASLDGGGGVIPTDDQRTLRIQSLLTQLCQKFSGTEQQVASATVMAQELLRKEGIAESLVNLLEDINSATLGQASAKGSYPEWIAAYVTMRAQGNTREETTRALFRYFDKVRPHIPN